jgi:flagellar motor switch protein FliN/FliY
LFSFQLRLRRHDLKADLDPVSVELTVVLGQTQLPIYKLLRMGRGAVIELNATETEEVQILANNHPFAKGNVVVSGSRISVEITELLKRPTVYSLQSVASAA